MTNDPRLPLQLSDDLVRLQVADSRKFRLALENIAAGDRTDGVELAEYARSVLGYDVPRVVGRDHTELVHRLRSWADTFSDDSASPYRLLREAADVIEQGGT